MSELEALQERILQLGPHDLQRLRAWFAKFDACMWDAHIEADAGPRPMKSKTPKPKHDEFPQAVGRALRRAGKEARRIARMHGTPVWVIKDGTIVGEKP